VPRDPLGILTTHPSKGLELPLVVVDIGSNFSRNHPRNAGLRFPAQASSVTMLEDDLAPYSDVSPARTARSALDRSFDDLVREYYVAYSRPQTALLLVGHDKTVATHKPVCNVAAWWRRDRSWAWHDPNGARSTFANSLPLVML
jgi:DNA helicase-2/ATP-dependent DNA helicase PcrA